VWNRLELASTAASKFDGGVNSIDIYRPSTKSAPIGELVLGAKYRIPM
jgi:hypothetical protein